MWEGSGSTAATIIFWQGYSSSVTPHIHFWALMMMPLSCKDLQDLSHVNHVLLMGPAAENNVAHPSKGCPAIPDDPVHKLLEGCPCVPEANGHPLILKEA
jgi:hypothetical protein